MYTTDCANLLSPVEIWAYQTMEDDYIPVRPPFPPASSSATHNHDIRPSVSSPASSQLEDTELLVEEEDDHPQLAQLNDGHQPYHHGLQLSVSHRFALAIYNFGSSGMRDDVCSCLVILAVFWFFASMTVILGFYGSLELQLGPNSSYLIEANPIFVQSIEAEQIGVKTAGPILYGFHKTPSRNVETTWSNSHTASVEPYYHTEWAYYLNTGSQFEISYEVKLPSAAPLSFVIAQGAESLREWVEYPSDPKMVLFWKIIYGSGNISQAILESDTYYVAVGNLNSETVLARLNITIRSVLYDTSNAHYRCSLRSYACRFKLHLLRSNVAILSSPASGQVRGRNDDWYIKVSYGPRWLTYLGGSSIMTALILLLLILANKLQRNSGNRATQTDQREALLSPKSNDGLNDGSSYDSVSNDEDDLEENLLEGCPEGRVPREGEARGNPRRLCVICYDAPRECFFLPCGHSATCFDCGARIAEEAGICPICRRKMKKVRKIFPV